MFMIPTIVSLIEVVLVLVPALLAVAYVTVAERKTMASMQRRLGPNVVGYYGLLQAFTNICKLKSKYIHTNLNLLVLGTLRVPRGRVKEGFYNNRLLNKRKIYGLQEFVRFNSTDTSFLIKELYKDRLAPVKPFNDNIILSLSNILDLSLRAEFFNQLENKGKGGIYLFQYKIDPLVYYIGITNNFEYRLRSHLNRKLSDKFHVFANIVGWDNFTISIIEISEIKDLGIRENYYLQKYLPLLNSTFSSNFSETAIFESLTQKLKSLKSINVNSPSYPPGGDQDKSIYYGLTLWVYKLLNTHIDPTYVKYSSLNKASQKTGIARQTLTLYLNTNVPTNGFLIFSKPLGDLDSSFKLAKKAIEELNLDSTKPKKVWVYTVKENKVVLVNNEPFNSRGLVANFLCTTHAVVRYFMDSWKGKGFNGYFLFSEPLTNKELESLLKLYLSPVEAAPREGYKKVELWVYSAETLELINNSPFITLKDVLNYFNMRLYRDIARHLDTELATKKGGRLVYFFSKEISEEMRDKLKNNINKASYATSEVWVYKNFNGQYSLLDNNQPFKSRLQVSKALKISYNTINKKLNTKTSYNELYFFSEKQ